MRITRSALVGVLAAAVCATGLCAGETPSPKDGPPSGEESPWRPEVPPGLGGEDPDLARFRVNPDKDPLRGFETDAAGWGIESWPEKKGLGEPKSVEPKRTRKAASQGEWSLALPVSFPDSTVLFKRSTVGEFRYVTYEVFVPDDCPGRVRALFFVKDKDGLWFQALSERPHFRGDGAAFVSGASRFRLEPGRWNTIPVDLRPGRSDLVPQGHLARWQERLAGATCVIGFAFFGDEPYEGELLFDNLRGWSLADDESSLPALAVRNLVFPPEAGTYRKWEASFELTREFANPFDPDEVRVDAAFTTPSGESVRVPGFFGQEFTRRLTPCGEEVSPAGPGLWMVRYAPREPGEHRFSIEVQARSDEVATGERTFTALPSGHPGYVRVSKRDPRCFELTNGEPFYPVGHNVRSPNDPRCSLVLGWPLSPDEGTFTYDLILERMAGAGENFVEVWMASWWLGLEWTARWKNYRGLGRYNLANAWRLDYVLERARELGMRVQLVIDNHGKYSTWCDKEWQSSPYNVDNRRRSGGFLRRPEEFFTNEHAKRLYKRKARYIFARWGYDPTILGFELISELDLIGSRPGFGGRRGGQKREVHRWHEEMIEYFRTVDCGRHVYTTHYSGSYNTVDPVMARLEAIDYVTGDGYRGDDDPFCELAFATAENHGEFGKPFMITEYGGNWNGTCEAGLEADLHSGLWGSYMTSAGGTPLLWWFDFIDIRDLYWHFTALARFAEGEDRRDPELSTTKPHIERHGEGVELAGLAYVSKRRGYAWVYSVEAMRRYPAESVAVEGARLRFAPVEAGPWRVEYWDTAEGVRFRSEIVEAKGATLELELPRFRNDLAMKLTAASLLSEREAAAAPGRAVAAGGGGQPPRGPAPRSRLLEARKKSEAPRPGEDYVLDWTVLGPFHYTGGRASGEKMTSFPYVPRERDLWPHARRAAGGREWRLHEPGGDEERSGWFVRLDGLLEQPNPCAAYAAAELVCDRPVQNAKLLFGSDDFAAVYLNGRRVLTCDREARACQPDQDRAEGLSLRAGVNRLLVKVVDIGGQWGFCVRFATADGRAIPVEPEGANALPARLRRREGAR